MAPGVWKRIVYQACIVIIVTVLGVAIAFDEPAGEGVLVDGEVIHASSVGSGLYSLTVKTMDGMVRVTSDQPVIVGQAIKVRERRTNILRRKRHSMD